MMPADRNARREQLRAPDPEGRVIPFRPRESNRGLSPRLPSPANDRDKTRKRWPEPWEEYYGDDLEEPPRRNLINIIGFVCTLLLIAAGLWLSHTLVEMRTIQDCVLSGRTNCAPIDVHSIAP